MEGWEDDGMERGVWLNFYRYRVFQIQAASTSEWSPEKQRSQKSSWGSEDYEKTFSLLCIPKKLAILHQVLFRNGCAVWENWVRLAMQNFVNGVA